MRRFRGFLDCGQEAMAKTMESKSENEIKLKRVGGEQVGIMKESRATKVPPTERKRKKAM